MSNRPARHILIAVAWIVGTLPPAAIAADTQLDQLRVLEKRLPRESRAVLKSLDRLEPALQGRVTLLRRARFLRSEALKHLGNYAGAEAVYKPLLKELTGDAESDPLLVARTALGLGQALIYLSRPSEADAALTLALHQLPEKAPPQFRAQILEEMTRILIFLGEPVNAADKATEALQWATRHNLPAAATHARYLLGYAYRNQGDTQTARTHFQRAREEARRRGDLRYEILCMNELGNLLVTEKHLDAAMRIKEEALKRAREARDPYLETICLHDFAYALSVRGEYPRALKIYRSIIRRETVLNNPRSINMARYNIAYAYTEMGRWDEALQMAEQSLHSVRKHHLGELEPIVLEQIVKILEQRNRLPEALQRQKELTALNKRKFEHELEKRITEIRDRHRLLEQESEIRILRQDKKIRSLQLGRQRILLFSLIGLVFFLALLSALALAGNRAKRKANRKLEELNHRLDDLSRTDPLTGLSNRRDLLEKLQPLRARCDRTKTPLAILMIDMDHFKTINDAQGHEQGDRVLQRVAGILAERVRAGDLLARWGGEEFLVVLADTGLEGARQAAEQLRRAVAEDNPPGSAGETRVTITVGVAEYTPGTDLGKVIIAADNQLYAGKRSGRNRVAG